MGIFKKPGFGLFSGSAGTPKVRNVRLKKVKAEKAADICKLFELQEQAQELLTEEIGPADFFRLLGKNRLYRDAVNFRMSPLASATTRTIVGRDAPSGRGMVVL